MQELLVFLHRLCYKIKFSYPMLTLESVKTNLYQAVIQGCQKSEAHDRGNYQNQSRQQQ